MAKRKKSVRKGALRKSSRRRRRSSGSRKWSIGSLSRSVGNILTLGQLQQARSQQSRIRSEYAGSWWGGLLASFFGTGALLSLLQLPLGAPVVNILGGWGWYRGVSSKQQKAIADGMWWAGWSQVAIIAVAVPLMWLGGAASLNALRT